MDQEPAEFEKRVVIVGVGLIGGSIAAAIRKRFPHCEVIGVGRSESRLQAAQSAGLLTSCTTQLTEKLLAESCVVVNCLPVDLIAGSIREIAALSGPDVLITDAGSVKEQICVDLQDDHEASLRFVGAHPIAGGENGGFEFADPDLFENRVCVITAGSECSNLDRTIRFWAAIGCRTELMDAAEHDRVLALTSHLPHVIAAAVVNTVGADNLWLTGSGFRDATRIAAGDAGLWKAILTGNRSQVVAAVTAVEQQISQFRTSLEECDDAQLQKLLADAAECRATLD